VAPSVRVREIGPGESLRVFIDVAWRINGRNPHWVPPLRHTLKRVLDRRRHPFHRHAEVAYFVALRGGGPPLGRVAAAIDHRYNAFHREQIGSFGFFESENDPEVAAALVGRAAEWLAARGMRALRGPLSFSTNRECGLLVQGFDRLPAVMMPYNPQYYADLLEACGLEKSRDLLAYRIEDRSPPSRLVSLVNRLERGERVTYRALDVKRFASEVALIKSLYNAAWVRNWGFVPMSDEEFEEAAREFRPIVDPALCLIAEIDQQPIGFSLALPDVNGVLRRVRSGRLLPFGFLRLLWCRRRLPGFRVLTLGLKSGFQRRGLGMGLYLRTWQAGAARGYRYAEASWVLEDNWQMRGPLESLGARLDKVYRIYERGL
jgi:hypothetical protein